jgi:hypothetical protein
MNDMMKGTMIIMVLSMINPIGTILRKEGAMKGGGARLSSMT